jgi:hypothetical protein
MASKPVSGMMLFDWFGVITSKQIETPAALPPYIVKEV